MQVRERGCRRLGHMTAGYACCAGWKWSGEGETKCRPNPDGDEERPRDRGILLLLGMLYETFAHSAVEIPSPTATSEVHRRDRTGAVKPAKPLSSPAVCRSSCPGDLTRESESGDTLAIANPPFDIHDIPEPPVYRPLDAAQRRYSWINPLNVMVYVSRYTYVYL